MKTRRRRKEQITHAEIGRELGLSSRSVGLAEQSALEKIRQLMKAGMSSDEVLQLIRTR